MKKIVGIRFKPAGKVYDFDAGAFVLKRGEAVIVETEQGLGFGRVAVPPVLREENKEARIYKKVFRLATEKDFQQREKNLETEKMAHTFCLVCIKEFGLEMNLFSVESTFDASKLTFFFTAEGRIDFRELVKVLVNEFHTRIEMRQVGIRNQAKMCGGIGRCGRELCCATFMEKFEPVSIRMAKEQNLSLNPTKISGLCGRLMCCLTFENETYLALKKNFPKIGQIVKTDRGEGKVIRHNVICNRIAIRREDGHEIETELDA
ncbi:stage 0 sporulation family protein [Desulfobacterales bacterium HSG2]|nr:stage 0 sporulation family protein [Desulfobacterales bacterium HSG2]